MGRPKGSPNKPSIIKVKNKKLFLESLKENLGILAPAIKVAGFTRMTFHSYYNSDPEFRLAVDEIRDEAVDFVEAQLFKQIKGGGAAQTIFYLKCKARDRGYIEQNDTNMTIDAIKIKYIVPSEEKENISLPLNNEVIKINIPE